MRQRLRDRVEQSVFKSYFSRIFLEIERLRASIPKAVTSTVGGGTTVVGIYAEAVTVLPPIPTEVDAVKFVYYGGQVWKARYGQTRWYPVDGPTIYSGAPGS